VNYQDNVYAAFSGAGESDIYDEVFIGRYYEYLEKRQIDLAAINVPSLQKHALILTDEEGSPRDKYSIYRSLIFDVSLNGQVYHLSEGHWYKVEQTYIEKLEKFLDPFCVDISLPSYKHDSEGAYN
jgi:uncharacterized protein (TIGR04141 family)